MPIDVNSSDRGTTTRLNSGDAPLPPTISVVGGVFKIHILQIRVANNSIPQIVKSAFRSLGEMFGYKNIIFIGNRAGVDYYLFRFPEYIDTGFPNVVAYESGNASNITGFEAIEIVRSLRR